MMDLFDGMLSVRADFERGALYLLDQSRLPGEEVILTLDRLEDIRDAIRKLKVRGAPAIGVTAAYASALCSRRSNARDFEGFYKDFLGIKECLASSRPTAVNLFTALARMERCVLKFRHEDLEVIKTEMEREADSIREEDVLSCRRIGELGLELLKPGMGILTHCNAGHLAVSEYGTALAPIYLGQERNYGFRVYADETRPLLQGARLTAYELHKAGVDVTLICDNMASAVMKQGKVQAVLVGCDRIAANGDVANKIGTSGVAVLAAYYGIPFYVLGPVSTIDAACPDGESIPIEERNPDEVTDMWYARRMAPEGIKVANPAFDVTSHELITAIITEKGIVRPPFTDLISLIPL